MAEDEQKPKETKPITEEQVHRMQKRRELIGQVIEEGQLVASGRRLVNRVGNEKKKMAVDIFLREKRIDSYPFPEADILEENEVRWVLAVNADRAYILVKSPQEALAEEIGRAYAMVGQPEPVNAKVMAGKLLSSDTGGKLGTLGAIPLKDLEVELVLAHFETLGYQLPPRLSVSIARRATLVILNRHWFKKPVDVAPRAM